MRKPFFFAYAKTKTQISFAVTAKLISAFVFATRIVQSLYFLNTKFQDSSHLVWSCSLVCVGPVVGNPEDRFSHNVAQMVFTKRKRPLSFDSITEARFQVKETNTYRTMSLVVRKPVFRVLTRSDTNQAVQPHKMARGWKFCI